MSQPPAGYTPQYSFWPYYTTAPAELLAPARTASWILVLLGVMLLMMATCNGSMSFAVSDEELMKQLREVPQHESPFQMTPKLMRTMNAAMAIAVGLYGIALVALGAVVRNGRAGWVIASIVVIALPLLLIGLLLLASLLVGAAAFLGLVLLVFFPVILMGGALFFLLKAAANLPKIALAEQQIVAMYQARSDRGDGTGPADSPG